MKKRIVLFISLALLIVLVLHRMIPFIISTVHRIMTPPSVEDVESFVTENWNDISVVNDYLLELGDRDAYISDNRGSILIDLDHEKIEDYAVMQSVQSLWKKGCYSIYKNREWNSISYSLWHRTMGGVGCGFEYAIDHTLLPEVQYQTELVPLSEEGWYYYLREYEKWRSQQGSEQPTVNYPPVKRK
ncbi:MAG: hypothetical protein K5637_03000 [Lachnospiraceae bacterium]|nr:hypothetical protein [Lachnospiraceae bacterium]